MLELDGPVITCTGLWTGEAAAVLVGVVAVAVHGAGLVSRHWSSVRIRDWRGVRDSVTLVNMKGLVGVRLTSSRVV